MECAPQKRMMHTSLGMSPFILLRIKSTVTDLWASPKEISLLACFKSVLGLKWTKYSKSQMNTRKTNSNSLPHVTSEGSLKYSSVVQMTALLPTAVLSRQGRQGSPWFPLPLTAWEFVFMTLPPNLTIQKVCLLIRKSICVTNHFCQFASPFSNLQRPFWSTRNGFSEPFLMCFWRYTPTVINSFWWVPYLVSKGGLKQSLWGVLVMGF